MIGDQLSDEDLLASGEPADFGCFYRRHVREVLGYMMRRTGDAEAAADLTADYVAAPYRYEVLEGRSHWLPEEAPDDVAQLLVEHARAHS